MKRSFSPIAKPKVKPQKKRFAARRDPKYTAWVRQQKCALNTFPRKGFIRNSSITWHMCTGAIQVAHVQSRGAGGSDRGNVVPLCLGAHHEQHSIGTKSFEAQWGINLKQEAERLLALYIREHGQALGDAGPQAEGPAGGDAA